MAYRKTVSLIPAVEAKLKAAAKRRGINDNRVIEIAVELLHHVDHVSHGNPVTALKVLDPKSGAEQERPMFFG